MKKINILAGEPFQDPTLTTAIRDLQRETAEVTTIAYTTFANPSTTERTIVLTENQVASQGLYVATNALLNLTSNITGAQTFTFKLYLGATVVATSVVSVPDAINTLFSVKVDGTTMYSRTNSTALEYLANMIVTPISTSATADVSTITVVNTQNALVDYDTLAGNFNTKLTCTASVGTATTTITAIGGRVTFDNQN